MYNEMILVSASLVKTKHPFHFEVRICSMLLVSVKKSSFRASPSPCNQRQKLLSTSRLGVFEADVRTCLSQTPVWPRAGYVISCTSMLVK